MADDLAWQRLGLTDEGVGITDVDCTPRPRRGESRLQFEARMRRLEAEARAGRQEVSQLNRNAHVRAVEVGDEVHHVAFCVCGFRGLTVADREVAAREYDAHACAVSDGNSIHRTYRGPVDRRPESKMIPALAAERAAKGVAIPGEESVAPTTTTTADEAERRMALLELK